MNNRQHTVKQPFELDGKGLHTGCDVHLVCKPAPANHGVSFVRTDIEGCPVVRALADFVVDTSRGTTLQEKDARVYTVEHILAALAGAQIDNAIIEMNAEEVPIMSGSAKEFAEAIAQVGVLEQEAERVFFEVKEHTVYKNEEEGVEFIALPADDFRLSVMIDYDSQVLGQQHAQMASIQDFNQEIAAARTFVFLHELEPLLKHNLIKGGDLANAIVYVEKEVPQAELDRLANLFNKPSVQLTQKGYLNNVELMATNEAARHKLLDVVGDLSLLGMPIKGHIIATRPGHKNNTLFAKQLRRALKEQLRTKDMPLYPADAKPLFDINYIMTQLPHRPPFLLVDKIMEMSDKHVVGLKSVTMNEPFFVGHFPGNPVMPGVLQIEAMAQTGGILVMSTVDDPENYTTLFMKIDKVKFRNQVLPGDVLHFSLKLVSPIRRGLCHMVGVAYVGSKVATEAELLAQIVKIK